MADFSHHEPCPDCGSRDNLARYDDGSGFCFGCSHHEQGDGTRSDRPRRPPTALIQGEAKALPHRALSLETCQKYRYLVGGGRHIATYCDKKGRPVAQKLRDREKGMCWVGDLTEVVPLFGFQVWGAGGKRVIVTEGEIDALSMSQAQNNRWPAVSIPNGAQAAKRDLTNQFVWEYLESFDEIVLMFDEDEPGRAAAAECAELFTPGKVRIAQLPLKDANEMLKEGRLDELRRSAWEAQPYRPDGVVNGAELWKLVSEVPEVGLQYPWPSLNQLTHGQRNEVTVWCAGTGIGKSQILKEIAFHLVTTHGKKVGIVSLEESVRHAGLCQMSLALERQLHLPEVREQVGDEAFEAAYKSTLGTNRYVFYDHFGSVDAEQLLPKLRYMAVNGCDYIVLDHISIAVSGMATEGDERKRIDELMTKLRSLVEKEEIGLHIISHLRKATGKPHEEAGM